jgi:tetratricopeptide (TPR) repeat protein
VPGTLTRADQIITGEVNYTGAKIVSLEQGQLRFRSADGRLRTAWLDNIGLMILDRGGAFADFNQAERFLASGEPERAVVRYGRALRPSEAFWSDLIAARLLQACDAAGQLDKATGNFIRLAQSRWAGPPAAARLFPKTVPAQRDGKVVRAIDQLDSALRKAPDPPQRVLLELLRYDILRQSGDPRAAQAAQRVAVLSIPPSARSEPAYTILLEGLREALGGDAESAALAALNDAIRDCPESLLPGFLLLKGRTLIRSASTREEIIRACWPLMRVAIHFPKDAGAAEGLYDAAQAVERIGRVDRAIELLEECLGHPRLTPETRRSAETALMRLRGTAGAAGG